ncbi:MAG: LamG-like jellyroll fold domain-containing protein [Myxococcota bacterium]
MTITHSGHFASNASELRRTLQTASNRRAFTFATWMKSAAQAAMLLGAGASAGSQTFVWAGSTSGRPFFQHDPGDYAAGPNLEPWPYLDQWVHLVISVDVDNPDVEERVRFWINGQRVARDPNLPMVAPGTDLYVGHTVTHALGNKHTGGFDWRGWLAETYLLPGVTLDADAFVARDDTNLRSIVYTGPVPPEAAYFRYLPGAPGQNGFPNSSDWTATGVDSDATTLPP